MSDFFEQLGWNETLEMLDLDNNDIYGEDLSFLIINNTLRYLKIPLINESIPHLVDVLSQNQGLKTLELSILYELTEESIKMLETIKHINIILKYE